MFSICLSARATLCAFGLIFFFSYDFFFSGSLCPECRHNYSKSKKLKEHYEILIWKLPGKPPLLGAQFSQEQRRS